MSTVPLRQTADVVNLIIEIDGAALPGHVPVSSVEVIHRVNRIPLSRIKLADGNVAAQDFPQSSGDYFVPGNQINIIAGYRDDAEPIFTGVIYRQKAVVRSSHTYLEIECRDPAVKMALNRNSRYHEEVTDSDIAESLISEYDLTADIESTDAVHPQLLQYHASDWDFMISRLEANGQVCAVEGGTVRSYKPSLDGEAVVDVVFGDTLLELDAEFDARWQSSVIKSFAWDPAEQALVEAEASDPGWDGNGNLTSEDMTNATARGEDVLLHGGSLAGDALQSWADGAMLRSRMAASQGRARFRGISLLSLGDLVQLQSISDRFNGIVHITAIRHEFSNNRWYTDIEFGLPRSTHCENFPVNHMPASGLMPSVSGLQIGVVTQLADDPAGENRVRVKIPVAGMDEQGVWARIATLDAGAERGTFFRPEVDDEVILGFLHGDPAHPVILGMLHSSAKAPPIEPSEDNHEKAYVSREGLRFHFDDDQKVITLETPGGNKIVLSDADEGIVLEDQHGNKIQMNGDGVAVTSAQEIALTAQTDLKTEATNLELKATAEFKAEGGASAEVSSSGMMTISGSLVQIN